MAFLGSPVVYEQCFQSLLEMYSCTPLRIAMTVVLAQELIKFID